MNSQELVELPIPEAIHLAFHGSFEGVCGDWVLVIGQDAFLMLLQCVRETLPHANFRCTGPCQPVLEDPKCRALVRLPPDLPQVFLEVVGGGQGRVQLQGLLQTLVLVTLASQVLRVLQEQPACSFEDLALLVAAGLAMQLPT